MDFMDKVAEGAREFANAVVKTTNELVDKGKQSLEISKLKGDRRDALIALGELTYGMEKGYNGGEAKAELIEKLDGIAVQINEIEAQRKAERQRREDELDAERARRTQQAEAENSVPQPDSCKECGQTRIGSLAYCAHCGAKFE